MRRTGIKNDGHPSGLGTWRYFIYKIILNNGTAIYLFEVAQIFSLKFRAISPWRFDREANY